MAAKKGNKNAKMRAYRSLSKATKARTGAKTKADKMKGGSNLRKARIARGENPNTGTKVKPKAKVKKVAAKVQARHGNSLRSKDAIQRARKIIKKRK